MSSKEIITQDGEVLETTPKALSGQSSFAVDLARAEIDQQVATAHAYPRSITKASRAIFELVTIDEESAKECNYALPRSGKPITGPSVRLAEIIASQWGNCRVGARVIHVDRADKFVEAEGVFHDLETGTATTARVRRRISDRNNRLFSDDMIIVTGNAACSIAKRNAILGGVPKAVWNKAYEAALKTIKGDVKTLSERRERMLKAFAAFGAKPEQIFAAINVGGIDDIGLDEIALLTAMHSSLKSGEATVEEMFNMNGGNTGSSTEKKGLKDKLSDVASGVKPAGKGEGEKSKPETQSKGDGDFPGDQPATQNSKQETANGDEAEAARDRGADAYHKGMPRTAVPKEYRDDGILSGAWLDGFDSEHSADQGGENA